MSNNKVEVSENKWNGTATLEVKAKTVDQAKRFARRYFRDEYGHKPSKIVAEKENLRKDVYTVMVANHSSGSLKQTKEYEV